MTPPNDARALLAAVALALAAVAPAPAAAQPAPDPPPPTAPEVAPEADPAPNASDRLDRGRQAFENADYEAALELLETVDPLELGREQRIQLHEMMGKCRYILDDRDGASDEFFEVLKLDKNYQMDPVRTPQEISVIFEATRMTRARDLRLFPVEPERTIPGWRVPKVASHNMFVAFAPAGVFRLAFLRTPGRGVALLSAQLVPIAASAVSYGYLFWAQQGNCNAVVVNAAPVIQVVNIASFITSVVVYAVGIIDAFLSQRYHGRAPEGRSRMMGAAGGRGGPPPAAIPSLTD